MIKTQIDQRNDKVISVVRKYELGYIFGVGTQINHYSFEVMFERGNGASGNGVQTSGLVSHTNKLYFLLGYRF